MLFDGPGNHFHSEIQHPAPQKKYENYTLVLITSNRFARLSIQISHYIDLINNFVTRCFLMVPDIIFILKKPTSCLHVNLEEMMGYVPYRASVCASQCLKVYTHLT